MPNVALGFAPVELLIVAVLAAFVSSLVWLIRNWNAHGPTDPWKGDDFEPSRRRRSKRAPSPERPDPHAARPLIEIGYWPTSIDPDRPQPDAFLDADWSEEERELVLRYLADGFPLPWEGGPVEWCDYCGGILVVDELTDGTYVWPTHLIHYSVRALCAAARSLRPSRPASPPIRCVGDPEGVFVEAPRRDAAWWNALSGP